MPEKIFGAPALKSIEIINNSGFDILNNLISQNKIRSRSIKYTLKFPTIKIHDVVIQKKNEFLKKTAALVDETSVLILTDATALAKGKSGYITKCAACHGMNGEGLVGPNLTDDYWIHGGGIKDIFKTIKYGIKFNPTDLLF